MPNPVYGRYGAHDVNVHIKDIELGLLMIPLVYPPSHAKDVARLKAFYQRQMASAQRFKAQCEALAKLDKRRLSQQRRRKKALKEAP